MVVITTITATSPYPKPVHGQRCSNSMFALIRSSPAVVCVVAADFLTTNEGDARELGEEDDENYFNEEIRVGELAMELGVDSSMYKDDTLGRLKVRCGLLRAMVCPELALGTNVAEGGTIYLLHPRSSSGSNIQS